MMSHRGTQLYKTLLEDSSEGWGIRIRLRRHERLPTPEKILYLSFQHRRYYILFSNFQLYHYCHMQHVFMAL